jgi:hypothetical protein
MVGAGRYNTLEPRLEFLQHPYDVLVFQRAEDQDDRRSREILIEGFTQALCRVTIMRRVNDDRWLAPQDLEAGRPFYICKSLLILIGNFSPLASGRLRERHSPLERLKRDGEIKV